MADVPPQQQQFVPVTPMGVKPRKGMFASWLFRGQRFDEHEASHREYPWYMVLWLTGVDYFSTLGYQPGIALLAAGAISPFATAILVAVTLFCALPIYAQVAGRSYVGQGSIAMLENLLSGWWGKLLVLVLLGFAATDFVITMTLSAADATQHAIENPFLHAYLGEGARIPLTIGLLALLAFVFLAGFSEAIGFASLVAIPYILLNLVVIGRAFIEIMGHPEALSRWRSAVAAQGDWTQIGIAAALIFPRLALGLSGFETGVSVMPLIRGDKHSHGGHDFREIPHGRIKNARKLLAAAAIIMSFLLLASSFVTTLLIPEEAYREGGKAAGRAIAYLAHQLLGSAFGSLYDASTILILWFAGASAMAGLLHLIPRYLPRYGMAPFWVAYSRPLVLGLFSICVIVTVVFRANVEAQSGAYATGVLVLMLSAALAAALALWHEGRKTLSSYCWVVAAVFAYTLVDNVVHRPDGIVIASIFIFITLVVSGISRYLRATELRVSKITFCDESSQALWDEIRGKKVNLVPIKTATVEARTKKLEEIARHYKAKGPLAFMHVFLVDNRSEFFAPLRIEILREGDSYVINATGAIAIANTIAYVSELIDPIAVFLGLTRQNLVGQAVRFLLLGEGETAMLVYTILLRYWEFTPEDDVRPYIFLMSD